MLPQLPRLPPTILAALGCWLEQVYLIWAGAGTLVVRLAWESEKLTGLAWGVERALPPTRTRRRELFQTNGWKEVQMNDGQMRDVDLIALEG